jgi:Erv1 / Alr family
MLTYFLHVYSSRKVDGAKESPDTADGEGGGKVSELPSCNEGSVKTTQFYLTCTVPIQTTKDDDDYEEGDQEGTFEVTDKGDEDDDDDDKADDGTTPGVSEPKSPMQERIQEAHARFVERKKLVEASLVAARKARLSKLESSGAAAGLYSGGPSKMRPGAALAVKDTSDVNRFKNELSQRRKESGGPSRLFTKDRAKSSPELKAPPTGATSTMRANQLLTAEYRSRREQLIESIRKHRGDARAKEVEAKLNEVENALDVNQNAVRPVLPFRKEVTKARIVEKIPIVKRIVKMSHEEELILDVSMSFIQGLKVGVFKSRKALSQNEQVALEDWLHLLRVTLPSEWALHNLIDDLLDQFNSVVKSHEALVRVLEKHPLHRDHWSLSCSPPGKIGGGFTCGFWKLLHVMTVGLAEHRGGEFVIKLRMARQDSVLFSPELAADTVREYIANFFPCTSCAEHFTERFDDCSYRRCSRLSDKVSKTTDADWKELAKWLWEFHNEVSIRVLHERADNDRKKRQRSNVLRAEQGPGAASVTDEIAALYPSIHDCLTCYNGDGSWNEDAIFVFLERQYW